jgi:hypothetical protein
MKYHNPSKKKHISQERASNIVKTHNYAENIGGIDAKQRDFYKGALIHPFSP